MRQRRLLLLVVIGLLIAAAALAGNATASQAPPTGVPPRSATLSGTGEGAWFCPGLPPAVAPRDGRVSFGNVGATPVDVVVTVLPDTGSPTSRSLTIPADSTLSTRRAALGASGALTVETFGGALVVEEGVDGSSGIDMTPCATDASTQWYFAAGMTPRGVEQWLVIDDPYATDAKVNVTLRTDNGVQLPDQLQDLDVSRRSRVIVPIHNLAPREDRIAVAVAATKGRVVAAQTLVFRAASGAPGIATTLGTPAPSDHIWFPNGASAPGGTGVLAIVNVGENDAQVDVQPLPQNNAAIVATSLTIAPDDVVFVPVGNCARATKPCSSVPPNSSYGLDVHAEPGDQIVAQTVGRSARGAEPGATTSLGSTRPVTSWRFASSQVTSERATTLSVVNPLALPAGLSVGLAQGGTVSRPRALQNLVIPAGRRVTLHVPANVDAAILVDASAPLLVERVMVGADETSRSVGVPVG